MEITPERLEEIKLHLRVENDDEDLIINTYALAGIDYVENFCDGSLVDVLTIPKEGEDTPREILFKPGIWAAILLLVGHWYTNREASSQSLNEIPFGVNDLLFRHRRWH